MNSTVTNLISWDRVTKNGISLTNMTSATKVTNLCLSIISLGMSTYTGSTLSGLLLTHFPLMHGSEGPKMVLALVMSFRVVGQSQNRE